MTTSNDATHAIERALTGEFSQLRQPAVDVEGVFRLADIHGVTALLWRNAQPLS